MAKRSIPVGFCEDCRWGRELPDAMKLGPFEFDCQALPWQYEPSQQQSKVRDPKTGKPMTQMGMIYIAHPHRRQDYCALFDERSLGDVETAGDGEASTEPGEEDGGSSPLGLI